MVGRTIAIGDIHGCDIALRALIEAIRPQSDDLIVALGDYVDRGPNTRGVIDQLLELGNHCRLICLLGNHEEMMLDTLVRGKPPMSWIRFGATDTLDSYGFQGDPSVVPASHIEFMQSCRDYHETEQFIFVHANYRPELPLDLQPTDYLRWRSLRESIPGPHRSGKKVIVGHTANKAGDIEQWDHLICIDTFCYGGGWLTALDPISGEYWQADLQGALRKDRLA
jgi:serine/threonine protein phosphatase 1